MSTSLEVYATRESMVGAVHWIGGDACYQMIKHWAKEAVRRDTDGVLLLQTLDGVLEVPEGDYIVLVGNDFHMFTPDELEEDYVKVQSDEAL